MKRRIGIVAVFLAVGLMMSASAVMAAESLKAGDIVEVLYMGEWRPGTVIKGNARGMVLAEYEFAGGKQQGAFRRNEVRMAFENGALSPPRSWKDSDDKLIARAVVASIDDKEVTLRKSNMKEMTVAISSLSEDDQKYLKQLQEKGSGEAANTSKDDSSNDELRSQLPPGVKLPSSGNRKAGPAALRYPQPPPVEQFRSSGFSDSSESDESGKADPSGVPMFGSAPKASKESDGKSLIEADPAPKYLQLQEGGVGTPKEEFFDGMGAVIPIGGNDSWVLTSIESHAPGEAWPTRLLWASLAKQKILGRQTLPPREVVLDYNPPAHRLLTYALVKNGDPSNPREMAVLTLWEVLPTDKQVTPIVRWKASSEYDDAIWGRLVNKDVVVQRLGKKEFVAWDTSTKTMLYRTKQESFFGSYPCLSGGRKYAFLPDDKGVRVLEAITGREVATLQTGRAAAVAVSDDGKQLAVLGQDTVTICDLTKSISKPVTYPAAGTPFQGTLHWLDKERLLIGAGRDKLTLYSIPRKMAIWSYTFDDSASHESKGGRAIDVLSEHLIYTAQTRGIEKEMLAVGAVALPGPDVDEAVESFDAESLVVLKPGMAVRFEVNAGGNNERIKTAIEKKIKDNGWILDPAAKIVVLAEMKQGQPEERQYKRMGVFGDGEKVTVTPFYSTVSIKVGNRIVWSGGSGGVPMMISLEQGKSIQDELAKYQRPNVEIFDQLEIPKTILDRQMVDFGLGTTMVTTRGLISPSELERKTQEFKKRRTR